MTMPTIRTIRDDEIPAYVDAMTTAFLERPDVDKVAAELRPLWDLGRAWAALDGDRICGTFRSWATQLTVPGGATVPAAAVAAVTVLPTHRRRGILTAMARAEHAASRERGEVAALLYASEYPIYGRFGYGPACRTATITLSTGTTGWLREPTGAIELAPTTAGTAATLKALYDQARLQRAGEIWRRDFVWDYDLGVRPSAWGEGWKGFVALHRDDAGELDGYVRYRAKEQWVEGRPEAPATIDDLHGLTEAAEQALWRFVAEIDWVASVKAEQRSPSDRLPWRLTNARAAVVGDLGDGMWVRLFDVARALEARTYEREGRFVLEVVDPEAAGGRVRVELDAGPDGARCRPTDRSPDLTVGIAALGAAWLGGVRLADATLVTGADEHSTGALATADRLLRTADEPWGSTHF